MDPFNTEGNSDESIGGGEFVRYLDNSQSTLSEDKNLDGATLTELDSSVQWLVKFSLSVAAVCKKKEEADLGSTCHIVLRELAELKMLNETKWNENDEKAIKLKLRDSLELLEQTVNNNLLKLIVDCFCSVTSPLDDLVQHILDSTVHPPDRRPEDVDHLVNAFDEFSDLVFHVAHFTGIRFSTVS